jgi:hypothetical protein
LADPDVHSRIVTLIREFKEDVDYAERWLAKSIRTNANHLVPEEEQAPLPPRARAILDRYALVDTLALHYRDRTRSAFIGLLVIAFLAMLVLELVAHILPEFFQVRARLIFWLYPVFWLAAWGLWYNAHRRRYQKKYHDYRALAEGLRVQFFWDLLRLPDSVEEYYLRKQQGELEWIRAAIGWWRERDAKVIAAAEPSAAQLTAQKELVRRRWVMGQLDYFTNAGPREKSRGQRCKRCGAILFWTSLVLALILGGWEVWQAAQMPSEAERRLHAVESVLIFGISMLLTIAAIVVAYGEKMAFSEHVRHYSTARIIFLDCSRQLKDDSVEIALIRNLGMEALQENGDWLLLHRDRPLEVIVP